MKTFIQESTLYPDIIEYLKQEGLSAIGETKIQESQQRPDILFEFAEHSFVVEVKLDEQKIIPSAIAQARKYAEQLGTENSVVLVYPIKLKNQQVHSPELLREIVLNTEIFVSSCSPRLAKDLQQITLIEFVKILKINFADEKIKVDFESTVNRINAFIRNLNDNIEYINNESLVEEVVDKLELFAAIGDFKDKESALKQVLHLASFLLFNQVLFYHIFQRKTETQIAELVDIKQVKDVQKFFDAIQLVDYKMIYRVNILGHVPNKTPIIQILNELIGGIKSLYAEHITHDLAGRFFHELIPFEVRKVLAAFYTHPNAADFLAGLVIGNAEDSIIDPACGSGTLLVAAYKRKQFLYEKMYGFANQAVMHKNFVENEITGIDIMPFAAHISTINLAMQNIEQITNYVRIATKDSLDIAKATYHRQRFENEGIDTETFAETIQNVIFQIYDQKPTSKYGAINADGQASNFKIFPVDAVIMNPPYSDREKMPQKWLDKLNNNELLNLYSGNLVNLWGYFMILGDSLLKENGLMGLVIPINFARGKAVEKVKEFIFKNHTIRYIVKPVGDLAFSEDAFFKDILFVTEKKKPEANDICKIVYFKSSIRKFKNEDIPKLYTKIRKAQNDENKDYDIFTVTHSELCEHQSNLMHFLWAKTHQHFVFFADFYKHFCENKKLINFPKKFVREGFHSYERAVINLTFITNPMNQKCRTERAFMIFDEETENEVIFHLKNTNFSYKISKKFVKKAIRTITGLKTLAIEKDFDYFIAENFADFREIKGLSLFREKKDFFWENIQKESEKKFVHLISATKFDIYSPNTNFVSFFSQEPIIATDSSKIYPNLEINKAKILCLFLNSVLHIVQILKSQQQTTGHYGAITETDLLNFKIPDVDKFSKKEIDKLLLLFDEIKNVEFPSIVEQIEKRFPQRVKMDIAILEVLGYKKVEISELLPELYEVILLELKNEK